MIALPVQGRCAFASLHPAVTFAFFTGALLLCMVFAHPLLQVEAVCLAALCYVSFRGRGAWPFIGGLAVLLAVVAFASPLFNTQGETVLFRWWAGRPYTLEALALGAPVALANATCLPELYGDTARYFDPYDYDVDLDALAAQPVAAPDEVLKKYSWDKTAAFWLHEMEKYANQ